VTETRKKIKLTKSSLERLEPEKVKYRIWDSVLTGFFVRVTPTGRKVFAVRYKVKGSNKPIEYKIGVFGSMTVDEARQEAKIVIGKALDGVDTHAMDRKAKIEESKQDNKTLGSFIKNHYESYAQINVKSHREKLRVIHKDFGHLLNVNMEDVSPSMINAYKSKSNKIGLKPSTISTRVATLKAILALASNPNKGMQVIDANPLQGYSAKDNNKSDHAKPARFLSKGEEQSLRLALDKRQENQREERLNHIDWCSNRGLDKPEPLIYAFTDHLKPIVLLALNTGMRKGEILSLEWSEVDLTRRIVSVLGDKSKSGQSRSIPLNDEANKVLRGWREQTSGNRYVFVSSVTGDKLNNINTAWRNIIKESEITSFRFHDLRHTFASNLVMRGISLNTVRELLGHHSIEMTLRYAHLAPEHTAQAVAVLND